MHITGTKLPCSSGFFSTADLDSIRLLEQWSCLRCLLPCIHDPHNVHACSVYNEKRISVEAAEGEKTEYRVWNPFRSKLAASVLAGVDNIHIKPGGKVLYLGAASGTSVSHVSDIVGPTGAVFAVEFSHRSGKCTFMLTV